MAIKILESELSGIKNHSDYVIAFTKFNKLQGKMKTLNLGNGSCQGASCRCEIRKLVQEAARLIKEFIGLQ